jgi:hypothetical protein
MSEENVGAAPERLLMPGFGFFFGAVISIFRFSRAEPPGGI